MAKTEIGLGQITGPESFRWQDWPQSAVSPSYIQRSAGPNAIADLTRRGRARTRLLPGEPITSQKLVKAGEGGVLAAILPAGMRAISTRIKEETGVGRLILPNDHVDVILTRRTRGRPAATNHVAETLFRNVRVLAIGQLIEAKDGKKLAEGNTATLELTPAQASAWRRRIREGEISLSLRSIADMRGEGRAERQSSAAIPSRISKYGVKSRAYGVN